MIAPLMTTYQDVQQLNITSRSKISSGLSRMFAAAVVNQQFCATLLHDPSSALQNGYLGETFSLRQEEEDLIVSIRANSLSDLAKQVNGSLNTY